MRRICAPQCVSRSRRTSRSSLSSSSSSRKPRVRVIDWGEDKGFVGFKTGIFADDELANIFQLFDLKRDGFISKAQCREALKSLGSSELHMGEVEEARIPEKVDCKAFLGLCESILGIKSKSR